MSCVGGNDEMTSFLSAVNGYWRNDMQQFSFRDGKGTQSKKNFARAPGIFLNLRGRESLTLRFTKNVLEPGKMYFLRRNPHRCGMGNKRTMEKTDSQPGVSQLTIAVNYNAKEPPCSSRWRGNQVAQVNLKNICQTSMCMCVDCRVMTPQKWYQYNETTSLKLYFTVQ